MFLMFFFWGGTLRKTNSSPLRIGRLAKRKQSSIPTIHFQVLSHLSFREGNKKTISEKRNFLDRHIVHGWSTNPPQRTPPPRNKGLIAGLIKGNQRFMSPDHKAGYFWGGYVARGGLVDQS